MKQRHTLTALRQHTVNRMFLNCAVVRVEKKHRAVLRAACLQNMKELYARYQQADAYCRRRRRQKIFLAVCQNGLLNRLKRDLNFIAAD